MSVRRAARVPLFSLLVLSLLLAGCDPGIHDRPLSFLRGTRLNLALEDGRQPILFADGVVAFAWVETELCWVWADVQGSAVTLFIKRAESLQRPPAVLRTELLTDADLSETTRAALVRMFSGEDEGEASAEEGSGSGASTCDLKRVVGQSKLVFLVDGEPRVGFDLQQQAILTADAVAGLELQVCDLGSMTLVAGELLRAGEETGLYDGVLKACLRPGTR